MIILASQSPRRHELMKLTGLPFTVRVADIDETMDPALPVQQEVTRVSRRKAQAIAAGAAQLEEIQPITPPEQAREYLMLRMRTLRGIEEWEYRRKFGLNFEPIARRLEFFESHHWAEQSDHRWHFTPQGFLLSNTLILELLDAQSGTIQEQTYWKELIGQPDSDQDP